MTHSRMNDRSKLEQSAGPLLARRAFRLSKSLSIQCLPVWIVAGVSVLLGNPPCVGQAQSVESDALAMKWADTTRVGRPYSKDPSVIRFGDRYLMYFSLPPFDPALAPANAPDGWSIGIAESRDRVTWSKVAELWPEQECDRNGLCAPGALVLDGNVHLFYQTYGNGPRDAICHAVSSDGIHFSRDASNPVFRPAGDWTVGRAIDAEVFPVGDQLLLYFATRDPGMTTQMLGVAGADLDSDFGRSSWRQLVDGPILKPELPWERQCIEAASVCQRGDTLFMFYAGGYNNEPQQIGVATSADGLHWTRMSAEPLLTNGRPGEWNASESGHPGVFVDEDGRTHLFYQGNNDKGHTWWLSSAIVNWSNGVPRIDPRSMRRRPNAGPATFTNPVLPSGADPWATYRDGFYYYMHTTARNLTLWKTPGISDLRSAEKKVVWRPPVSGPYSRNIWAPEIHFLQGKWYIYFAADDGRNSSHRTWVLENDSADPLAGEWTMKGQLTDATDRWAIDASVFDHRERLYVVWSGWEGEVNDVQHIYIAAMKDPWTIEGPRVKISTPTHPWETVGDLKGSGTPDDPSHVDVNEGPTVLKQGDKLFLVYAASGCWTESYCLGMLTADGNSDLLDPASWRKSAEPVFTSRPEAQAHATGHCSFFKSPVGKEDWILFHANPEPGQGCGSHRQPRAQPVSWKDDGTPDFGLPIPLTTPIRTPSGAP